MSIPLSERPSHRASAPGSETAVSPTPADSTAAAISEIARRAAGLEVRLHPSPAPLCPGISGTTPLPADPAAEARWTIWLEEAAGSDDAVMARRLEWDGLSLESARMCLRLGDAKPVPDQAEWTAFLLKTLTPARPGNPALALDQAVAAAAQVPFAPAYLPILAAAAEPLESILDRLGDRIAPAAKVELIGGLLSELSRLAGRVLATRFSAYLSGCGAPAETTRCEAYDQFTNDLARSDYWMSVWEAFPVLARLLAATSLGWTASSLSFLHRLEADWAALENHFFLQAAPSPPLVLERLAGAQGDRHGGSSAVRVLGFSRGRVVYKARPLDLEADYNDLLRSLATAGMPDAPPALRVLPRPGYGWVEFAEHKAVANRDALDAWFRSAGGLLCLLHLLGATDGHMENIVATLEGPILIDVETLLQPRKGAAATDDSGTFSRAARQIEDSVLQTGLLPLWQSGPQGRPFDIGGFTGTGGYESPVLHATWEHVGTNAVRPAWRRAVASGLRNLPVHDAQRHGAGAHLATLTEGFSAAWRFLQSHREWLAEALKGWSNAPLRVIIRPTTHYATLLERALALPSLQSGLDRSLIFEALRRPMARQHTAKPAAWAAVTEEIRALDDGDIPIFFARAGGHDLDSADGRCLIPDAFGQSAVEVILTRLDHLTEAELARQLEFIAAAFIESETHAAPPPAEATGTRVDIEAALATARLASDAGLVATATVLGKQLMHAAIRGRDGFVTWVAPSSLHPGQHRQQGMSYYFYDGASGISLFLAALARVTGDAGARHTALAALEPIRAVLDDPRANALIQRESIGGCSGLASLVYTLTVIAGLLDEPSLVERAQRVSRFIDEARIAKDQGLDIVNGSAGAVLALLALHRVDGDSDSLQRAIACGRHLLARAERVGGDALAWPSWPDGLKLAGYSHGAAGIASALGALFRATGDPAFGDAALAALRYERTLFNPAAGNWPMLLPAGGSQMVSTWCHGAPGILLGRASLLGLFSANEESGILEEMDVAWHTTVATGLSPLDHLCCGTMGRVEILHTVAPASGGRTTDVARLGATLTIQRAQHRRAFTLQTDPVRNAVFQPGFFRGLSGLGFSFLRLAHPSSIPAVLDWQSTTPTP
ncbi:MAG: type 2 lanthipeptide synthetase LanM [Verrucomicrobiales bacterium]